MAEQANHSFGLLGVFLRERLTNPICHVSFWTYFLLAIVGFGAVGVWVEVIRWKLSPAPETSGILTAIYTYFPAVAAGATLQLLMASNKKYIRSFSLFVAAVIAFAVIPHSLGLAKGDYSFYWGLGGTGLSLMLWWVANGTNQDYLDGGSPDDTLGGKPDKEPSGEIGEFNV